MISISLFSSDLVSVFEYCKTYDLYSTFYVKLKVPKKKSMEYMHYLKYISI